MEYYRQRYNLPIKNLSQPLLVSMPKERDRRGGSNDPIVLVPETCQMTGLTDEQRSNFHLMSVIKL